MRKLLLAAGFATVLAVANYAAFVESSSAG